MRKLTVAMPIFILLTLLTQLQVTPLGALETPVNIPDPNLRREIAKALNKPVDGRLTQEDMKGLTKLRVLRKSIADLTGLQFAINLKSLVLRINDIRDVSPLASLINLERLILADNAITDVSPLASLVNLKILNLTGNPITDVSPLIGLRDGGTEITGVTFGTDVEGPVSSNAGTKATPTVNIPDPNLRRAIADALKRPANTPITQENMTTLTTLWASGASIKELIGLEFAVNLEDLVLSDNAIMDVSPLANLRNLETLDLTDNPITDVAPLINLRNGGTEITGVTFDDANPLDRPVPTGGAFDIPVDIPDSIFRLGITNVLKLTEDAPITRGHMTTLTSLWISGASVTDLTGLEFAVNLEDLFLSDNAISDISPLATLGNLKELDLSRNVISDVSPLANLGKLRLLTLSHNIISDVSPLANLINLKGLNLHNNGITNVSPLANLINLKGLILSDNPITDERPLDGLRNGETEVTTLIYGDELLSSIGLWCSTPDPPAPTPGTLGAAGEQKHFWRQEDTVYREANADDGIVLTVRFMNGTPLQKEKVEHFVPLWAEYAALKCRFTSDAKKDSDIRVRFEKTGYRSHSVLGTVANEYKEQATLVLGNGFGRANPDVTGRYDDYSEDLPPSGTILHEFGHALGLLHEQSNPAATLQDIFDIETVKKWVAQTTADRTDLTGNALQKEVDKELCRNYDMLVTQKLCNQYNIDVLERDEWTQTNYTAFDPESIMLYPGLPLKEGGLTQYAHVLSETDKEFIGALYPDLKPSNIEVRLGSSVNPNPYPVKTRTQVELSVKVLNKHNHPIPKAPVTLSSEGRADITFSRNVLNTGEDGTGATAQVTFKGANVPGSLKVTAGNFTRHLPIYVTGIIKDETKKVEKSVTFRSRKGCAWNDWKLSWYWTGPKTLDFSKECEELYGYSVTAEPGSYGWDENGDAPYVYYEAMQNNLHSKHSKYVQWDGKKVSLWTRIREHCTDQTTLYVEVTANCRVKVTTAAPSLQAQLRPETEALSTLWQELSEIPAETALLLNYPNPFNPETWIPYHLSEPADVTLRIYAADGKLIRTLALGHQPAGVYESKSRAAYWDGRNRVGERVASGLYFYTLTAGDFAATGKMLILK